MAAKTAEGYKGIGMDGLIARWYARNTRKNIEDYRKDARKIAGRLPQGAALLEVAPGPGYPSIELAKLGSYRITGLDISATFVDIARANAQAAGAAIEFRQGTLPSAQAGWQGFHPRFARRCLYGSRQPCRAPTKRPNNLKGTRAFRPELTRARHGYKIVNMVAQILILNAQLAFAVTLKQALERTGQFGVHPFTTADAAVDYLREHPQAAALVDFTLPGMNGEEIVQLLRDVQPGLPIIASPRQSDAVVSALDLQGTLDASFSTRDVIPLLNEIAGGSSGEPTASAQPGTPAKGRPSLRTRMLRTLTSDPGATRDLGSVKREQASTDQFGGSDDMPPSLTDKTTRRFPTREFGDSDDLLPDVADKTTKRFPTRELQDSPHISSLGDVLRTSGAPNLFDDDLPDENLFDLGDSGTGTGDALLDEILSAIQPDEAVSPGQPDSDRFADLVNSMRGEEPHKPLPERSQPFVEFILTGGMESLLNEIERSRTGETDTFEKLADEEPPPPTLEESGTVGDLMTGVSDSSFRNVLSLLRGDEPLPELAEEEEPPAPEAFPVQEAPGEATVIHLPAAVEEAPAFDFDDWQPEAEGERTPAQMILETALDETTPPESFSLDTLIESIERQLPAHKPNVQPLPSWIREGKLLPTQEEAELVEPDFLPEFDFSRDLSIQTTQPAGELPEALPPGQVATDSLELSAPAQPVGEAQPDEGWDFEALVGEEEMAAEEGDVVQPFAMNELEFALYEPGQEPTAESRSDEVEAALRGILTGEDRQPPDEPYTGDTDQVVVDESWLETPPPGAPRLEPDWEALAEFEAMWGDAAPESLSETQAVADESDGWAFESALFDTNFQKMAAFDIPAPDEEYDTPSTGMPSAPEQDPRIAQFALSLTQVSLELTAEATLLTRDGEILAYAGRLEREDVEELRQRISDDWDAQPEQARLRFVRLEGSGRDFMLYSRRTVDDLTLSMIFAGTTPLRDIRRQGKRLVQALQGAPGGAGEDSRALPVVEEYRFSDEESAMVVGEPSDGAALTPYAYVWLTREPDAHLSVAAAQAIMQGLRQQLRQSRWRVRTLQAQEDYVYLVADVPGEAPALETVRDLKRRSAQIAGVFDPTVQPEALWADSYLVVAPGRELDIEEIQQFINFERMM